MPKTIAAADAAVAAAMRAAAELKKPVVAEAQAVLAEMATHAVRLAALREALGGGLLADGLGHVAQVVSAVGETAGNEMTLIDRTLEG